MKVEKTDQDKSKFTLGGVDLMAKIRRIMGRFYILWVSTRISLGIKRSWHWKGQGISEVLMIYPSLRLNRSSLCSKKYLLYQEKLTQNLKLFELERNLSNCLALCFSTSFVWMRR